MTKKHLFNLGDIVVNLHNPRIGVYVGQLRTEHGPMALIRYHNGLIGQAPARMLRAATSEEEATYHRREYAAQ
jgi:hypothetical protein